MVNYIMEINTVDIHYSFPDFGTFRLLPYTTDEPSEEGNILIDSDFDICFILDYAVPVNDIIDFQERYSRPLIIYDHHQREPVEGKDIYYHNPVAYGSSGKDYPSCTWVIKSFLELEVSDMVLLGIAGDIEDRFITSGFQRFPR